MLLRDILLENRNLLKGKVISPAEFNTIDRTMRWKRVDGSVVSDYEELVELKRLVKRYGGTFRNEITKDTNLIVIPSRIVPRSARSTIKSNSVDAAVLGSTVGGVVGGFGALLRNTSGALGSSIGVVVGIAAGGGIGAVLGNVKSKKFKQEFENRDFYKKSVAMNIPFASYIFFVRYIHRNLRTR